VSGPVPALTSAQQRPRGFFFAASWEHKTQGLGRETSEASYCNRCCGGSSGTLSSTAQSLRPYVRFSVCRLCGQRLVGAPPATRQPSPSASPRCSCAAPQKEPPLKEGVSGTWLHRRSFCSMLGIDSPPFSEREGTFGPAELLICILSCTTIGLSVPLDAPGSTTVPAALLRSCFSLAAGDSA
jgi:hypothetical protein